MHTTTHTAGPGTMLMKAMKTLKRNTTDDFDTLHKMHRASEPTPQTRPAGGLYSPLMTSTAQAQARQASVAAKAVTVTRGPQPAPVAQAAIAARQNVAVEGFGGSTDHAGHLIGTFREHDALLQSIRDVHAAGGGLNPSRGPVSLTTRGAV